MPSPGRAAFASLLAEQLTLQGQIDDIDLSPRKALTVGAAVLRFADREDEAFWSVAPLLDPAARAEIAAEHEQFAEDLELLAWLLTTTPDSPDVVVLTASLERRMRQHVERDGRLLARAANLAPHR